MKYLRRLSNKSEAISKSYLFFIITLILLIGFLGNVSFAKNALDDMPEPYRKFFVHYVDKRSYQEKILNFLGLTNQDMGRSFALIAGVSSYPNLPLSDQNLEPAAEDLKKLEQYLKYVEFFDEIVVLKNNDVNLENLNFFLQGYFPKRLEEFPQSRFLFAYSGHGFNDGENSYLLKSLAYNSSDIANSINLDHIKVFINEVVKKGHHILVLLNSCYSGAFLQRSFQEYSGFKPLQKGAHAITAGGTQEETWHDPRIGTGSIFFEKLFAGLDGRADILPKNVDGTSGDGIITVHELAAYLKREIRIFTDDKQNPQLGDISKHGSRGEFFFLDRSQALVAQEIIKSYPLKILWSCLQNYGGDVTILVSLLFDRIISARDGSSKVFDTRSTIYS